MHLLQRRYTVEGQPISAGASKIVDRFSKNMSNKLGAFRASKQASQDTPKDI